MQVDTIAAWQVEEGDHITLGSETVWKVVTADDCTFVLRDEDGEDHDDNPVSFDPDDYIELVVSFEDESISDLLDTDALIDVE